MSLNTPIRYINDGEPLNEVVLNRYVQDSQQNLENLFSRVDGYDPGTTEAISDRVVLRDNDATSKFGVPTDDQHPWRLNEFREYMYEYFEETDRSNNDPMMILNYDHLPKATNNTPGIAKLIQSYTSTDDENVPSADALGDLYRWLVNGGNPSGLINNDRLPKASTSNPGIVQLANSCNSNSTTQAATAAALNSCLQSLRNDLENQIGDVAGSVGDVNFTLEDLGVTYGIIPDNQTPQGQGGAGWVRFPSGIIFQAGSAITDSGQGYNDVFFPIAFENDYSVVVSERYATGWYPNSAGFCEPTVYGYQIGIPVNKASARIYGARINQYSAPAPRLGTGLLFSWFAMGY